MSKAVDAKVRELRQAEPFTETNFTQTEDRESHTTETGKGHAVKVTSESDVRNSLNGTFDDRVMQVVRNAESERQAIEDTRANRRNRNRLLTLLGAMVIGLVVVWGLQHMGPIGMKLAPYSFIITVLFDSSLTLYAYIRRY